MKKKKSILHLSEATFLLLLLILISTLCLLKYLQAPGGSYSPMLHLIQLTLLLVVLTLALTLIQRELLSRLLVNAFRDITGIHNKTSLENKITELGELPSTFGIGVMMFDLNNLKHVNDTYGHEKNWQLSSRILPRSHRQMLLFQPALPNSLQKRFISFSKVQPAAIPLPLFPPI